MYFKIAEYFMGAWHVSRMSHALSLEKAEQGRGQSRLGSFSPACCQRGRGTLPSLSGVWLDAMRITPLHIFSFLLILPPSLAPCKSKLIHTHKAAWAMYHWLQARVPRHPMAVTSSLGRATSRLGGHDFSDRSHPSSARTVHCSLRER